MDQSFLLMLSNLLHLQNHLDPTSSLFSDASSAASSSSPSSPSSLLASSSAAPLLFFTIASVLSYVATARSSSNAAAASPSRSPSPDQSLASFRALSSELIWSMEPSVRDARWRSSYGLSYPVFTTVVDKLKPHIALSNLSLPADYAVAMVLSRLSRGLSASSVARRHNLDPFLVSKITNMVTRLLSTKLYPEFIKIPVSRRLHSTSHSFHQLTSLPNVCGAIDSSPIRLRRASSSSFLSSKHGFPALLLQVVADHNKIFWDVCVKAPGSLDDASHFRDSLLYHRLLSGDVVWDKVVNVRGHPVRPYIVGDWCYPLLSFLLTPFPSNPSARGGGLTPAQQEFNAALMNGRSAVVDALGLLKSRWKILQNLNVGINHAPQTIVACCVLHNLCQIAREPEPEHIFREPEETGTPPRVLDNERSFYYYGDNLRQILADDLHQRLSSR